MENLQLKSSLGIAEKEIISIYGAGGKTSLLYLLARELSGKGNKVVITTTTKIFPNPDFPLVLASTLPEATGKLRELFAGAGGSSVILAGSLLPEGKLKGIDPLWPGRLIEEQGISCVLAECDGSAGRPLKGYASYEPVLPPDSSITVPILGLSGLGALLNPERVHRPELFARMAGINMGEPVKAEHLTRSMKWMIACGRRQALRARIMPIFNQVDLVSDPGVITGLARLMTGKPGLHYLLFASFKQPGPAKFIFELSTGRAVPKVSCVVLAAGLSRRMGRNKLTLELGGATVLERTLQNIARSGISEIIVVINPGAIGLKTRLSKYNIKLIVNEGAPHGISTSVRAGLSAVAATSQGVIFALGDQPLIPTRAYDSLLKNYCCRLPLAAYPVYRGRRGNPVLFDRRTWPALMTLEGDQGGSQLLGCLPEHELCSVEMDIPEILLDLDTPGDYEDFLNRI